MTKNTGSKTAPISEQSSNKAINGGCKQIRNSYGKADGLVHTVGLLALAHFNTYGDATGLARVYDAMPKSTRRGLFGLWCSRYGGVNITMKDNKPNATKAKEGAKNYRLHPDMDAAAANPWHSMPEADNEPKVLDIDDLMKLLDGTANRIQNMLDGKTDHTTIAPADRTRAGALVKAIKMFKAPEAPVEEPANEQEPKVEAPAEEQMPVNKAA
jgi:hypothetical protein